MITVIKDFRLKESYSKLVQKTLFSYLYEGIYKPLFQIAGVKLPKAKNSLEGIIEAIREGNIYYENGVFKAKSKFTNAQSLQLEKWGAKYSKRLKGFVLPYEKLPAQIIFVIAEVKIAYELELKQIDGFLKELQNNLPYMVDSMLFTEEVIMILDDAQNEIQKNVKNINVIVPELTISQKQEIAQSYTNNMRFYIKGWAENQIPAMRERVQKLVLEGYRPDTIQKFLEKEYKIGADKSKFLAQNETSIMLAEYKKVTYKEMGFDKFIWRTITDGKERELHKELNGTTWSYDNPPVIDERTGQRGLPGQTYNCRCDALPFRDSSPFKMHNRKTEAESREILEKYLVDYNSKRKK